MSSSQVKTELALGPLMMDLEATSISDVEKEMLLNPIVGGVILFTRNFESIEQIQNLVADIKKLRSPGLLVAVDHEGGRVQRFRKSFTVLPALASVGQHYKVNPQEALQAATSHAWIMAAELAAIDIDFSFAPVLDIDIGLSSVIGDRSFSDDKQTVSLLAEAYIEGMHSAGMSAVGKHFPGHGQVKGDTHKEKPVDCRSLQEILDLDGHPFSTSIMKGLDAVMPAHVIYEQVDNCPAGYSASWLQTILREQLGFKGAIFSDDLSMAGADNGIDAELTYTQKVERALNAGCDMGLVCNDIKAAQHVLENYHLANLDSEANKQSEQRRLSMLHNGVIQTDTLQALQATKAWEEAQKNIECLATYAK